MTPKPVYEEREFEFSAARMRQLISEAAERVIAHIESLPAQPSADTAGAAQLARELREEVPEEGVSFTALLDLIFDRAVPKSFNTAGPGYLAYIPGGGLFASALADFIAASTNRYVGVWAAAPALVQLEANVISWFCHLAGYPESARGILVSGGSLANFSAIVAARRQMLPANFLDGTIYVSDQTHHSVRKAAILAGFPEDCVRAVETDENFRIQRGELEKAIEKDRRAGLTPFCLVGNAGSTNTGAVDNLEELAEVARRQKLWFHVDGAYGGFFLLTDEGKRRMAGIEKADSIVLDPHKGLFLPYGTGCLLVRDGEALKRAHALTADYLPQMQEAPEFVDFCQYSPELSRAFRGLRVWLPFKLHGMGAFRRALQEKLDLARFAREELTKIPGVEILAEPQLSILAFRLARPGLPPEELNELNRDFLARINARRRVYLTSTMLRGSVALRICVLSFRTHRERMEEGLEDIRAAAAEIAASPGS